VQIYLPLADRAVHACRRQVTHQAVKSVSGVDGRTRQPCQQAHLKSNEKQLAEYFKSGFDRLLRPFESGRKSHGDGRGATL
jgi:hypothetical protein